MRFLILLIGTILLSSMPLSSVSAQTTDNSSVSVDKENVTNLIETLESETARKQFISNLKTMVDAKEDQDSEDVSAVTDALGIDNWVSRLTKSYEKTLEKYGMDKSVLGKIIVTVIAMIISLAFLFLVHKLGSILRNKVISFNQKTHVSHNRFRLYSRMMRYFGYVVVTALLVFTLNNIWDLVDVSFLDYDIFGQFMGQIASLALIVLVGIAVWEALNYAIEKGMRSASGDNSTRLQTILPIVRNVFFIAFSILFVLIILSEFGIDIMPLLAGAGVLGIAVGFGAQTMVKDFLTGFIIILEDLIQVGDVATLGGKTGLIERITIRKVQMRALDGTVMTVPFGEITVVENLTKEFSFYLMDVGVAYRENTDEVIGYMREVDEELRKDEDFKDLILAPIEILGVDQFADSAVVIKARIKTKPIRQWDVGREYNRRMKFKFDEQGVEIPFPHQTIYFGEDKKGNAPSAPIRLQKEDEDGQTKTKDTDREKSKSTNKAIECADANGRMLNKRNPEKA